MIIKFEAKLILEDDYILDLVNSFQNDYNCDYFDKLEECPKELIIMALYYFNEEDIFESDDFYDIKINI